MTITFKRPREPEECTIMVMRNGPFGKPCYELATPADLERAGWHQGVPIALPERAGRDGATGIYVRATCNGKWGSHDIAELDTVSLLRWLRSGEQLAERTVALLLGNTHEDIEAANEALREKGPSDGDE